MIIGAQLYTVRDCCRDLDSLDKTLRKIAEIGYTSVQLSGVCSYDGRWMKERLEHYGLTADITHFNFDKIADDTDNVIRLHDEMGCYHIGIGMCPYGVDPCGLDKMIERAYPAFEKIASSGHRFMYHNHNREYALFDGKSFLDLLCEKLPPELCGITFDAYWAAAAGADPAEQIRKLAGRVNCVHFKDMIYSIEDGNVRMAAVGDGNMNYPEIIRACRDAGVTHIFVEQDNCYGEDPFECLKRSYIYLKNNIR